MTNLLVVAVGVVVVVLLVKGIRIVPQSENWIVETLGRYSGTLKAGLNLINPLVSRVVRRIDIRERVLDLPEQSIITSDNASVTVDGVIFFKIMDPYKACYGIEHLEFAIQNLGITTLRSIMGKLSLDESLSSRERINAELLQILDEATDAWGTKITRVEIKNISPPADLAAAMAQQKKAEQEKRATILKAEAEKEAQEKRAEGYKRAQILEAEARKEAAERDAEARERLAQAEAKAIGMVMQALQAERAGAVPYLIGQEYVKGLVRLAESQNAKVVLLPSEVLKAVQNLVKGAG